MSNKYANNIDIDIDPSFVSLEVTEKNEKVTSDN
jgi:hypothetical protein